MPRLLVTVGDPRGIGPEIVGAALDTIDPTLREALTVVSPDGELDRADVDGLRERFSGESDVDAPSGAFAAQSIERAVSLLDGGSPGAIVTGPLHKPSLRAAGWNVPGQTEFLAELSGSKPVGMLMTAEKTSIGGPLRVLLATTHIALRDVPAALTRERLSGQLSVLNRALRSDWGLPAPRIGVCGVNPHAGDSGLFGDEEATVLAPVIAEARDAGVDVSDPLPADTIFGRALRGDFDAVLAPYHDVGMAAFKTVAFGSGVNVTLGLPFVRTSPDHGTAFDIAGSGQADPASMIEAIRLAHALAVKRFDTQSAHV